MLRAWLNVPRVTHGDDADLTDLEALRKEFEVVENGSPEPASRGEWSMYLESRWYTLRLSARVPPPQGIVASLDGYAAQRPLHGGVDDADHPECSLLRGEAELLAQS